MRTFVLHRDQDPSGVSGTGIVAEGVEFSSGAIALTWIGSSHSSIAIWQGGEADVLAVHGHDGLTRLVWETP